MSLTSEKQKVSILRTFCKEILDLAISERANRMALANGIMNLYDAEQKTQDLYMERARDSLSSWTKNADDIIGHPYFNKITERDYPRLQIMLDQGATTRIIADAFACSHTVVQKNIRKMRKLKEEIEGAV